MPPATFPNTLLSVRALQSRHAGPLSIDIDRGQCVAIVGESGSGKSVFLRMLADLDPCTGDVLLDGVARSDMPAPQWRSRVVYQAAELAWWDMTAAAHLAPGQRAVAESLVPMLRLPADALTRDLAVLSTGERQRLGLIRSLAAAPRVLLLDEPTASLDAAGTHAVEALLLQCLADGMAIVLVTHSLEQAGRLAGGLPGELPGELPVGLPGRCLRMVNRQLVPA